MKKGQTTLEYAMVIAVVVAGLLAIQVYMKRAVQGKLRVAADDLGQQYSPKNTSSNITISSTSNSTTNVKTVEEGTKLKTTTTVNSTDTESRKGEETVGNLESSLF